MTPALNREKIFRFFMKIGLKTGFQSDLFFEGRKKSESNLNIGSFTAFKKEFIASAIRSEIRVANGYRFI